MMIDQLPETIAADNKRQPTMPAEKLRSWLKNLDTYRERTADSDRAIRQFSIELENAARGPEQDFLNDIRSGFAALVERLMPGAA